MISNPVSPFPAENGEPTSVPNNQALNHHHLLHHSSLHFGFLYDPLHFYSAKHRNPESNKPKPSIKVPFSRHLSLSCFQLYCLSLPPLPHSPPPPRRHYWCTSNSPVRQNPFPESRARYKSSRVQCPVVLSYVPLAYRAF